MIFNCFNLVNKIPLFLRILSQNAEQCRLYTNFTYASRRSSFIHIHLRLNVPSMLFSL
jgi:hypothetical protein